MKKFALILSLFLTTLVANAQIMRVQELEKYAKSKFGEKWVDAAANLGSQLTLDKNNSLTYTQIIDGGNKSKDQLYVIMNYWITASFNDANSVIKLNDKESGTIIAEGFLDDIAGHMGGISSYDVSIRPIIKVDIKDHKVRVTYTVQNYEVDRGAGILISSDLGTPIIHEKWVLEQCYPFAQKDSHKKTSSKALVMTHAFSNVIMDKIEEAVKNGVIGNETEDW